MTKNNSKESEVDELKYMNSTLFMPFVRYSTIITHDDQMYREPISTMCILDFCPFEIVKMQKHVFRLDKTQFCQTPCRSRLQKTLLDFLEV